MRFSKMFIPTKREIPTDVEIESHKLMIRSGMIKKSASGIYNQLPLGLKVERKIESIIKEEVEDADFREMLCSALIPSELWQESGRWARRGAEMFRLEDRTGKEFCLGPTHEEVFTDIVRQEVSSYKQLPVKLYQIQSKYRDEKKPRFGTMRTKSFTMFDAYSFDKDEESLNKSYEEMIAAFKRIFDRCGVSYSLVEAESGIEGAPSSIEFMVKSEIGEDELAICSDCTYAANRESAECMPREFESEELGTLEEVHTPDARTIKDLEEFFGAEGNRFAKTIIYYADGKTVTVVVRGDREVNENKVKRAIGEVEEFGLATDEMVKDVTGSEVGFAGPIGINSDILLIDEEIANGKNLITGANKTGYHFKNANFGRDFEGTVGDFRNVREGDKCPKCGAPLKIRRGIEIGHIFKAGQKFSENMNAMYRSEEETDEYIQLGCYEIGTERLTATIIEQNFDADGIVWPLSVAPFEVEIIPVNLKNEDVVNTAERIYKELKLMGVDVLIDDRDARPGTKFKDSDLIGIPVRITVGRDLKEGLVEMKFRNSEERELISAVDAAEIVREKISELR